MIENDKAQSVARHPDGGLSIVAGKLATSIEIDPNVRVLKNQTYVGFEDVTGPFPMVGEFVEVVQSESRICGLGEITFIEPSNRLIYLAVDWASLREGSPQ